jgi:hypothetical protein
VRKPGAKRSVLVGACAIFMSLGGCTEGQKSAPIKRAEPNAARRAELKAVKELPSNPKQDQKEK